MGKNKKKLKYRDLIDTERKANARKIKKTEKPVFNLVRLVKEPCKSVLECKYTDHSQGEDEWGGLAALQFIIAFILLIISVSRLFSHHNPYTTMMIVVFIISLLFGAFHSACAPSWKDHRQELTEIRKKLLAKTDGELLYDVLERMITNAKEQLFGKKSEFKRWTDLLDGRTKEVDNPTESVTEKRAEGGAKAYREPTQVTRIRIVPDHASLLQAQQEHIAFEKQAHAALDGLLQQARALQKAEDGFAKVKKIPNADKDAQDELFQISCRIQEGMDVIVTKLETIGQETAEQNASAARASAGSYSSEAHRETERILKELQEAETGFDVGDDAGGARKRA